MTTEIAPDGRRRLYRRHQLMSLVAAVLVGSGAGAISLSLASSSTVPPAAATPTKAAVMDSAPAAGPPAMPDGIMPVRLRIPSVGLDAPLAAVGLDETGALSVPADFAVAGWYSEGPRPGDPGPAAIVGHVDSHDGPAVFFRLRDLEPHDRATVDYSDGSRVEFRVYHRAEYPKDAFPTVAVYGDTLSPELRLITCAGPFDRSSHSYANNVIVWARAG